MAKAGNRNVTYWAVYSSWPWLKRVKIAVITSVQNCSGGVNTPDNFSSELLSLYKIVLAIIAPLALRVYAFCIVTLRNPIVVSHTTVIL